MSRAAIRLLGVPLAAAAVALTTLDPTRLAGAEPVPAEDVYEAADNPELTAVNKELTARLEAVAARTAEKEELTDQLLAGRAGLAAVADQFLRLNAQSEEALGMMRHNFPASDDRESAARTVLEYARQRADPAAWPRLRDRLAAEYRAAFHHDPRQ